MTDQFPKFSRFDRDPEALAWARTKVQGYVDQLTEWEKQATERDATAKAAALGAARILASRHFLGGGCVIGAFDERRPDIARALDGPGIPVGTTVEVAVSGGVAPEEIGRQVAQAMRKARRNGPESL
jgi:hypothetical protein